MQTQALINKTETPRDGYRYKDPDTQVWIKAASWIELVANVKKHRKANNLPCGLLIDQEIETQFCSMLPPGYCTYTSDVERKRASMIDRPDWKRVGEMTRFLFDRLKGTDHVSKEVADERSKTCGKCHFNQSPSGCGSCNSGARTNLIARVLGTSSKPTPAGGSNLQSCLICGCELKVKIWFQQDLVQKMARDNGYFESLPEWCWIKTGSKPQS